MIVKSRTFYGVICEQIVYHTPDRICNAKSAKLRVRFKDEADRERHKNEIARKRHVQLFNETFSTAPIECSFYSTLTFDTAHEVHTYEAAKRVRDNYVRRLRYHYPESVVFAYLGQGNKYERIHMHVVSTGIPAEAIIDKWDCGSVKKIDHLREHNYYEIEGQGKVDHGRDYTGLANYLYNHWTPEQGGHRCKTSGRVRKPETEPATEVKRTYSETRAPQPPKGYKLVESKCTPYGYFYYKYVMIPPKDDRADKRRGDALRDRLGRS